MHDYVVIVDELGRYGHEALKAVYRVGCHSATEALRPILAEYPFVKHELNQITDGYWYHVSVDVVAVTVIQLDAIEFRPAL